jgi:recyclin-1
MAHHIIAPTSDQATRFLASHNPAQVKRNVLASFTDVLLLPVTIVPKTVGAVGAAGSAAVQGIQMLNPQRWGGGMGIGLGAGLGIGTAKSGYTRDFEDGGMLFEIGADEYDEDDGSSSTRVVPEKTQ